MSEHSPTPRARLWRVLAIVWLLLISGIVIVNRVATFRLSQRVADSIDYLAVLSLEERMAGLEQQLQAVQSQPAAVSQAAFTGAHQALDERLARLEEVLRDAALTRDLAPLQERLSAVEARVTRAKATPRATAPVRAPVTAQNPAPPPDPPFTVLAIELRGGKQFLSLAPAGAYSIEAVRVLQPGEAYEDWQLEALDGEAAVFRVGGRLQRITVP